VILDVGYVYPVCLIQSCISPYAHKLHKSPRLTPLRDGNISFGLCGIRVGLTVQDIALRPSEWAIGFNATCKITFRKGKARF
jgi:hypothetical protein